MKKNTMTLGAFLSLIVISSVLLALAPVWAASPGTTPGSVATGKPPAATPKPSGTPSKAPKLESDRPPVRPFVSQVEHERIARLTAENPTWKFQAVVDPISGSTTFVRVCVEEKKKGGTPPAKHLVVHGGGKPPARIGPPTPPAAAPATVQTPAPAAPVKKAAAAVTPPKAHQGNGIKVTVTMTPPPAPATPKPKGGQFDIAALCGSILALIGAYKKFCPD